jgi:hypothetical protein
MTTPIAKPNMVSKLSDNKDLNGMLKELRRTKAFKIERDNQAGTVIVTHLASGLEVFRALRNRNVWIVRLADNLFQEMDKPVSASDLLFKPRRLMGVKNAAEFLAS